MISMCSYCLIAAFETPDVTTRHRHAPYKTATAVHQHLRRDVERRNRSSGFTRASSAAQTTRGLLFLRTRADQYPRPFQVWSPRVCRWYRTVICASNRRIAPRLRSAAVAACGEGSDDVSHRRDHRLRLLQDRVQRALPIAKPGSTLRPQPPSVHLGEGPLLDGPAARVERAHRAYPVGRRQ